VGVFETKERGLLGVKGTVRAAIDDDEDEIINGEFEV
jgi:hypothetical protein